MDPKSLELLEYTKIQKLLVGEASTELGRKNAWALFPTNVREAVNRQKVARELVQVLEKTVAPDIPGVADVSPKVLSAEQGVVLTGADLRAILDVLVAMNIVSQWLKQVDPKFHSLKNTESQFPHVSEVVRSLEKIVDENGDIKDSASPKLSSIRKSIRLFQERIRRRAEEIVRKKEISLYLQEPLVTIRNDRYVIPVKQEYISKIKGLVHDQSATGQTLFVEPGEIVEMGNNLRRLGLQERDEIEHILEQASSLVGSNCHTLLTGMGALGDFDLALAKARLSMKWEGSFPEISGVPEIVLAKAWHPLLTGNPVPLDITLNTSQSRTVIITGPNMGGKTVALKTVGLLTAMALAGLPCPCQTGTKVGDIRDILCVIGDEQSIEDNLSTFSSHITNLIRILGQAQAGKLVLIDELAGGTDPKEGSALAVSIAKKLHSSGCLSVLTSHYSEMKLMSREESGIVNAGMEWDAVNMAPAYRLVMGRPGRSNAFVVAGKLGMDEKIIEDARNSLDQELVRLEDIISDMEASSQQARQEQRRALMERQSWENLKKDYESRLSTLEAEKTNIINMAKREASSIVRRAKIEFERSLKEIRVQKKLHPSQLPGTVSRVRQRLEEAAVYSRIENDGQQMGDSLQAEDISEGMEVAVLGFGDPGIVVEPPDSKGMVLLRIGNVSMRTPVSQLYELHGERTEKVTKAVYDSQVNGIKKEVSTSVDVRGTTSEDMLAILDKYLDDAFLANLPTVTIIHGKGSGVLRKAVNSFLDSNKERIREHRPGNLNEGGLGVTIATLRLTPDPKNNNCSTAAQGI